MSIDCATRIECEGQLLPPIVHPAANERDGNTLVIVGVTLLRPDCLSNLAGASECRADDSARVQQGWHRPIPMTESDARGVSKDTLVEIWGLPSPTKPTKATRTKKDSSYIV